MERLTIDGGEVWLGFARNRVKAFKRAGIRYTRQVFEMPDGARIIVELAGKDHTIRLNGTTVEILSGVAKGCTIEESTAPGQPKPTKTFKVFKPTVDAAKKVLKDKTLAASFLPSKHLIATPNIDKNFPDPQERKSQIGVLNPGLFSGAIRKVIQVLLGLKKPTREQVEITYDYRFLDSYGVYKDSKKDWWLIRISKEHGVIAMSLPVKKMVNGTTASKAVNETIKLFGGIPTGKDFPKDIKKAITEKKVLELATKEQIAKFYELNPYYDGCGWSFSDDGSEAHNTGHKIKDYRSVDGSVADCSYSFHYKITIEIEPGGTKQDGSKTDPEGTATLTEVSSNFLHSPGDCPISITYLPSVKLRLPQLDGIVFGSEYDKPVNLETNIGTMTAIPTPTTVLVGHDETGKLYTLGYKRNGYPNYMIYGRCPPLINGEDRSIKSPMVLETVQQVDVNFTDSGTTWVVRYQKVITNAVGCSTIYWNSYNSTFRDNIASYAVLSLFGCRDGYLFLTTEPPRNVTYYEDNVGKSRTNPGIVDIFGTVGGTAIGPDGNGSNHMIDITGTIVKRFEVTGNPYWDIEWDIPPGYGVFGVIRGEHLPYIFSDLVRAGKFSGFPDKASYFVVTGQESLPATIKIESVPKLQWDTQDEFSTDKFFYIFGAEYCNGAFGSINYLGSPSGVLVVYRQPSSIGVLNWGVTNEAKDKYKEETIRFVGFVE